MQHSIADQILEAWNNELLTEDDFVSMLCVMGANFNVCPECLLAALEEEDPGEAAGIFAEAKDQGFDEDKEEDDEITPDLFGEEVIKH